MQSPLIIAISGASGSGKSLFTKNLFNLEPSIKNEKTPEVLKVDNKYFLAEIKSIKKNDKPMNHPDVLKMINAQLNFQNIIKNNLLKSQYNLPITIRLVRPDGEISLSRTISSGTEGAIYYPYQTASNAISGKWFVEAYLDKEKSPIGKTSFEIRALPEVLCLRPSGGSVYYSMDTGSISVPGG